MTNGHALPLWAACLLMLGFGTCAGCATYAAARSRRVQRKLDSYAEDLDRPLRRMLLPPRGRLILSLQVSAMLLVIGCALGLYQPWLVIPFALLVPAPTWVILYMRKKRRERIEAKLDVFALALANATRATPSVGRALQMLQSSLTKPIDAEVGQVLRELRVGSSLEQALLNFSWRVDSPVLDALLSSVLIARRIGGNLAQVLETTASTLREMARLDGVLRSKTAQARTQMWVLAAAPVALACAFSFVKPGYFAPLLETPLGWVLCAVAFVAWLSAILLARRILAVEL